MSNNLIFEKIKKYRHNLIIYSAGNTGKQVCDLILSKNKNVILYLLMIALKKSKENIKVFQLKLSR